MIVLKTSRELALMREAGRISAGALKAVGDAVEPGVTTAELDQVAADYIKKNGAEASFMYNGFPACACISINNTVIHGVPSKDIVVKNGDIVSVDVGAYINGYHGDNAATFAAGDVSPEAQRLMDTTRESLFAGIEAARVGARLGDVSNAIQRYVESRGYSVVREYVGHGVGTRLHEDPSVPNYGRAGRGVRLLSGMTLAIEPMVNQGVCEVKTLPNGIVTADGKLSAHFENTIAITPDGPVILTAL